MNHKDYLLLLQAIEETREGNLLGQAERGKHYGLSYILRNFGVRAENSKDAVNKGNELLRRYEDEHDRT